jgi:hypothetical protein
MRVAYLIAPLLLCAMSMQIASAQQAPKLPKGTDLQTPIESTGQEPRGTTPPPHPTPPAEPPALHGNMPEPRPTERTLLGAQTAAIKALSKRIDELEARVQQLEAGKRPGSQR